MPFITLGRIDPPRRMTAAEYASALDRYDMLGFMEQMFRALLARDPEWAHASAVSAAHYARRLLDA